MTSCGIFPSGDFRSGSGTKATTYVYCIMFVILSTLVFYLLFS